MSFVYNNQTYILFVNDVPFRNETSGYISIFEHHPDESDDLVFVNYFSYYDETPEKLIDLAKHYIDYTISKQSK